MGSEPVKTTVPFLQAKKKSGRKITMLTAYDYPTARLQDQAGIDIVFVGDSVGTNVLGYRSPQEVTMSDMVHHTKAVRRGVERAFLLADMPFMSYQPRVDTAVANAGRLVQEGGADGVKLEGGTTVLPQIRAIAEAGIPVMAHIGFTPQSQLQDLYVFSNQKGTTVAKVQGKGPRGALTLLDEALKVEDAGAFGLVLEEVTEEAAAAAAERLTIPVIGIGAGRFCDGQVLVVNDLIGLNERVVRLAKAYTNWRQTVAGIFSTFRSEVEGGLFPTADHALHMEGDKLAQFKELLSTRDKQARHT